MQLHHHATMMWAHWGVPCRSSLLAAALQAGPGLSMLQSTRPIDRMRYQAKLLFDHFDGDKTGTAQAYAKGDTVKPAGSLCGTCSCGTH